MGGSPLPPANAPVAPPPAAPISAAGAGDATGDIQKQAFAFAGDATKQLITVATGVVTATAVFSKDLSTAGRYCALGSWIILTFSVLFGLGAMLSMTGNLHNAITNKISPTLSETIHWFSRWQVYSFIAGIFAVMIFGFVAASAKAPAEKPTTINCIVQAPGAAPSRNMLLPPSPAPQNNDKK